MEKAVTEGLLLGSANLEMTACDWDVGIHKRSRSKHHKAWESWPSEAKSFTELEEQDGFKIASSIAKSQSTFAARRAKESAECLGLMAEQALMGNTMAGKRRAQMPEVGKADRNRRVASIREVSRVAAALGGMFPAGRQV